ncbi:MAG: M56 family metallopeptidase, partial [Acidobacteriota bacterium]
MMPVSAPIAAEAFEPAAWTLLHFVWQGALIALLTAAALRGLSRASSQARYAAALTGLALMALAPAVTYRVLAVAPSTGEATLASATTGVTGGAAGLPAVSGVADPGPSPAVAAPPSEPGLFERARAALAPHAGWLVGAWFLGVLALALRHAGGLLRIHGLRRRARPVADGPAGIARLCARLGLRRRVPLYETDDVDSPLVIGFVKPAVLVPPAAFFGLAPQQLEAILLHELAHIRRFDAWANLFQVSFETLFFYHPAVWWLSGQIRELREHCCDDIAVAHIGEPLLYAQALAAVEEMRPRTQAPAAAFALGAAGGSLLRRIRRLVQPELAPSRRVRRPGGRGVVTTALAAALAVGVAAVGSFATGGVAVIAEPAPDEIPAVDDWPDVGDWVAEEAAALEAAAVRAGYGEVAEVDFRQLARWGFDAETFAALAAHGLRVEPSDLEALARYGADAEDLRELGATGVELDVTTVRQLLRHGVDADDIASWRRAGYADITVEEILDLSRLGLDGDDAAELAAAGYPNLALDEMALLARHGLDGDDIAEFAAAGEKNLTVDDLVRLTSQGLDGDEIAEWRRLGLGELALDDLIRFSRHGLDPEDVVAWRRAGYELSAEEILRLSRRGLGAEDVAGFREAGLDVSLAEIEKMARYGLDGDDVAELRSAGLGALSVDEMLNLSQYGLDGDEVAELR